MTRRCAAWHGDGSDHPPAARGHFRGARTIAGAIWRGQRCPRPRRGRGGAGACGTVARLCRREPSVFALAAAIGYAFARIHHPFVDGNKRVTFYAAFATLRMTARVLDAAKREAAEFFAQVAAGDLDERALAAWLERNSIPL